MLGWSKAIPTAAPPAVPWMVSPPIMLVLFVVPRDNCTRHWLAPALAAAQVDVFADEENPGYYAARFYLRPHFQLEGMDIGMSLVSRLPGQAK